MVCKGQHTLPDTQFIEDLPYFYCSCSKKEHLVAKLLETAGMRQVVVYMNAKQSYIAMVTSCMNFLGGYLSLHGSLSYKPIHTPLIIVK